MENRYDVMKIFKVAVVLTFLIAFLVLSGNLFESVDQNEVMVIQHPFSGQLDWYTSGGTHWQGFGKVTKYPKRVQYWFSNLKDQGKSQGDKAVDQSARIRFNDGGHATVSGSISWAMPMDATHLTLIHQRYGTAEAVEQQVVRTALEKSIYMTGPLMSSKESYAERRNDLLQYIDDQLSHGVYKTFTEEKQEPDPITGAPKTVHYVRLVEVGGKPSREDKSPLEELGVATSNLSINEVKYDPTVETQIAQQQQATMQVQTAKANAIKAEQDAITAAKNGEAEAAKAKWEQEVIKARAVTEAQQKLEVAKLEADAAEQYKRAQILKGEGEGAYKRAVMQADGALERKLAAYVQVQQAYADAISKFQGNLVPSVVTGGGGANANGLNFMELLGIKAARDLALDLNVNGTVETKGARRK